MIGKRAIYMPEQKILGSAFRKLSFFCILIGIFLINMPLIKLPSVFITISDIAIILGAFFYIIYTQILVKFPLGKYTLFWYTGGILIVVGLISSTLLSGLDILDSLILSGQYVFVLLLLPLIIASLSKINLEKIILIYIVGLIIVCLFGIVTYFFIPNLAVNYMIGGRMGSLMGNPNSLSKTIAITLPILIYLYIKKQINFWILCSVIFIFTITLMIASSFGGIISSILAITISLILINKIHLWSYFIIILLSTGLIFANTLSLPVVFEKRIYSVIQNGNFEDAGSSEGKIQLMSDAIDRIAISPIVGSGANTFSETSISNQSVHNTYLLLWSEGGLLSLFGFTLVLIASLLTSLNLLGKASSRILGAVTLATTIIFMINAVTSPHLYGRFWFAPLVILLVSSIHTEDSKYQENEEWEVSYAG